MFSMKIDIQEVTAAIPKTQKKYSTECCNLNYVVIKAVSTKCYPVLRMLFNKYFDEESFWKSIKIESITSLPQEEDKSKPKRYKHFSFLHIIGKNFWFSVELLII